MKEFKLHTSIIPKLPNQIEGIQLVALHEFKIQHATVQTSKYIESLRQACIVLRPERYFNPPTTSLDSNPSSVTSQRPKLNFKEFMSECLNIGKEKRA